METAAEFWQGVDVKGPTDCWPWLRGGEADGYGRLRWHGVMTRSHRVAYLLHHGSLPAWEDRLVLDHSRELGCAPDRRCCNPAHLQVVSIGENTTRGSWAGLWRAYRLERERQEHALAAASYGYPTERADLLERREHPPLITFKAWLVGHAQST